MYHRLAYTCRTYEVQQTILLCYCLQKGHTPKFGVFRIVDFFRWVIHIQMLQVVEWLLRFRHNREHIYSITMMNIIELVDNKWCNFLFSLPFCWNWNIFAVQQNANILTAGTQFPPWNIFFFFAIAVFAVWSKQNKSIIWRCWMDFHVNDTKNANANFRWHCNYLFLSEKEHMFYLYRFIVVVVVFFWMKWNVRKKGEERTALQCTVLGRCGVYVHLFIWIFMITVTRSHIIVNFWFSQPILCFMILFSGVSCMVYGKRTKWTGRIECLDEKKKWRHKNGNRQYKLKMNMTTRPSMVMLER